MCDNTTLGKGGVGCSIHPGGTIFQHFPCHSLALKAPEPRWMPIEVGHIWGKRMGQMNHYSRQGFIGICAIVLVLVFYLGYGIWKWIGG